MITNIATHNIGVSTLVELLVKRALHQEQRHAYSFLRQGEVEESRLTYGELDAQARAIARMLQEKGTAGKPVILLHAPGLAYIAAFFGCLYAGAIAIPAYPPNSARSVPRIEAIVTDSQADIILTGNAMLSHLEKYFAHVPALHNCECLASDTLDLLLGQEWQQPAIDSSTLAFLQYTSGSTATPKGVMVTHGNLLANLYMLEKHIGLTADSRMVSWLPPYHDMGLIGGILSPLYTGYSATLMAPVSFLQRPFRWLKAISDTSATISFAPNFAYELCLRKVSPAQRDSLDLSTWNAAINGAEAIPYQTLVNFHAYFASSGFQFEAFIPGYGLAENTLMVGGGKKGEQPFAIYAQKEQLQRHKVVHLSPGEDEATAIVGYDSLPLEQTILIVNPETLTPCADDEIGEIWIASPCVGQGYWRNAEATRHTFQAYTADNQQGPFLRTGDLGFFQHNCLFVTGRLKDVIIIRGRNYYPHDIEATVNMAHPAIRPGCSVAFSVEEDGREQLIILAEIDLRYQPATSSAPSSTVHKALDANEILKAIRRDITEQHDLQAHEIVLLKAGGIFKTSSGKLQRRACRAAYLDDSLSRWM